MRSYPKTPKILPWLAKKAGISESRAATLWHQAERWAEHRAKAGSSLYFKLAVDRLLQLALAESLRAAQHGSALTDRGWRLIRSTSRLHQPG